MRYTLLRIAAVLLLAGLAGCENEPETATSHGSPVTDYVSLVDGLRAAGATVEPAGELSQPFFAVAARVLRVDGEDVQVFEYPDAAAAEREASLVSAGGDTIGNAFVTWIAPPHFYRAGRVIVLYVGDDPRLLARLAAVVGPQFAGG